MFYLQELFRVPDWLVLCMVRILHPDVGDTVHHRIDYLPVWYHLHDRQLS